MAGQPLSPGQGYDIKIAGGKTHAHVDNAQHQVDISNLTQRDAETLSLNDVGLVNLALDEPLMLGTYQQDPVMGGLIIIDRLTNITINTGLMCGSIIQELTTVSQFSASKLELNTLVHHHFPHWSARDLLGGK